MFVSILALFVLPYVDKTYIKSNVFKPLTELCFGYLFLIFYFWFFRKSNSNISVYRIGLFCAHIHLLYFFLYIPIMSFFELGIFFKRTRKGFYWW